MGLKTSVNKKLFTYRNSIRLTVEEKYVISTPKIRTPQVIFSSNAALAIYLSLPIFLTVN